MLAFICQYWIEFVFGIIIAGITWFFKRFLSLMRKERQEQQAEFYNKVKQDIDELYNKTKEDNKVLQKQITDNQFNVETLKKGLLSVQGQKFKKNCEQVLESNQPISLRQFESLSQDHQAYNALGGNHEGDTLFALITEKYKNQLV